MKSLMVANLIGVYGKKIPQGLTTKIESVRLLYAPQYLSSKSVLSIAVLYLLFFLVVNAF